MLPNFFTDSAVSRLAFFVQHQKPAASKRWTCKKFSKPGLPNNDMGKLLATFVRGSNSTFYNSCVECVV